MSRFGEAEPGLRPARLSRTNYVVDTLKEKSNTDIRDTKILMLFKISVFICLVYFGMYSTFSILCTRVDRITKGRKICDTYVATASTEFIAGRSLTTHSSCS
jgi:hypothetical protein